MLALQMLERIKCLHEAHFLHRDIKPDNFLMGQGASARSLFIIDFGLARRYISREKNEHIPFTDRKTLIGTARYASINNHLGQEQSRRDDLEAIGYMLVYFLKGGLPWQGLGGKNKTEKYNLIKEKKVATPVDVLCKGLPPQFAEYIRYCRRLNFAETPDYDMLASLFEQVLSENGLKNDGHFDWMSANEKYAAAAGGDTSGQPQVRRDPRWVRVKPMLR